MTLKISYNEVFAARLVSAINLGSLRGISTIDDLFDTERNQRVLVTSDVSGDEFTFALDLGSGNSATVDHFIIQGIEGLTAQSIDTVILRGGNTDISSGFTDIVNVDLGAVSLIGPTGRDAIETFTETSAYRFFEIFIDSSVAAVARLYSLGRFFIGIGFDMGREPVFEFSRLPQFAENRMSSGALARQRIGELKYKFRFTWEGITDAKVEQFYSDIVHGTNRNSLYLYTTANHQILNDEQLVHCKLASAVTDNASGIPDFNTVIAEFEEIVG